MHNIDDILAKYFSGQNITAEEEKLLGTWQLNNPKEFEALKLTMAAKHAKSYKVFDTKKGWNNMSERIDKTASTKTFSLKPILKFAAAASIAILFGIVGFQFFKASTPDMIVFENNTQKIKPLVLPDGSKIILAQNSKLEYAKNFTDNRNLKLNGEAFFDVTKNKEKPFTINTEQGLIRVLGTSFNVNTNHNKTHVDVKTGLVSLSHNSKEIKLAKNESAWSDGQNISQSQVIDINRLAWRTGHFQFDNTPFEEVIKFLESHYGDVIDVKTSTEESCSFTGTFSNENIDGIIEALILSCNLEFSKENDRIILK